MLLVRCVTPRGIRKIRQAIELGELYGSSMFGDGRTHITYESKIPYLVRMLIDKKISSGVWVSVPRTCARSIFIDGVTIATTGKKKTRAQIEICVDADHIISHDFNALEWSSVAPFRQASYDIEVSKEGEALPVPYDTRHREMTGEFRGGNEVIMVSVEGWNFGQ